MKKYLFALLFLFLLVFSCVPNAQENKLHHQAELHHDLGKEDTVAIEQVFSLQEDTVMTIVCEGGTKLIIPAGAFELTENPQQPVQGPVELRVLEVYEPATMLRHHVSTQEKSGKLLESAGMLYLAAFAGEKELRLKEGKEILLGFPKKEKFEGAALFSGTDMKGEALRWKKEESTFDLRQAIIDMYFGGDSTVSIRIKTAEEAAWMFTTEYGEGKRRDTAVAVDPNNYPRVLAEDESITDMVGGLAEGYDNYFFFTTPQLNWINCDRFVEEEVINLRLNTTGYPQNTLYYLVFEDLNSVMAGYRKAGEPEEKNPVFEQVPLGHKVKLVVVFNRAGDYYLAQKEFVVAEGQHVELDARETAKEDLLYFLNSLGQAKGLSASR